MSDTTKPQAATAAYMTTDTPFEVIPNRPMPDFDTQRRSIYPFDDMFVGSCFYAGKGDKGLVSRLHTAIYNRKKKHPDERYNFERMDNGDLYIWRTA